MNKESYYDYDEYVKNHFAFVKAVIKYSKALAKQIAEADPLHGVIKAYHGTMRFHVVKAPRIIDHKFYQYKESGWYF